MQQHVRDFFLRDGNAGAVHVVPKCSIGAVSVMCMYVLYIYIEYILFIYRTFS